MTSRAYNITSSFTKARCAELYEINYEINVLGPSHTRCFLQKCSSGFIEKKKRAGSKKKNTLLSNSSMDGSAC